MVEIAISVAGKLAEYLVVPVVHQFSYIWKYKANFENLEKEVEKLKDRRVQVLHMVEESRRNAEEIEQQVSSWIKDADKTIDKASEIIQENQRAKMKSFKGLCLNPKKRHRHSRRAAKKTKVVSDVLGEGDFNKVSYRKIPEETWLPSLMKGFEDFESRKSTSMDILTALINPEVYMVGVYGQEGIGKTWLAKEVHRQAETKKLFHNIVFVEVSKNPNVKKIQGEICDKLGLNFREESETGRAGRLHARLTKENKILIILDNIWGRLDFDKVGIPFGEDHKGCKLLLTSRNQDVLSNEMDSQKNFRIDVLQEDEAWNLFKRTAGNCIEDRGLQSTAKEVAMACGGVPNVIVTRARALKDKGEYEWKNALVELKRPPSKSFSGAKRTWRKLSIALRIRP